MALQQELESVFGEFKSELKDQNDNYKKIKLNKKLKTAADEKINELKQAIKARQIAIKNEEEFNQIYYSLKSALIKKISKISS